MAFIFYILIFLLLIVLIPLLSLVVWIISKFVDIKRLLFGSSPQSNTSSAGRSTVNTSQTTQRNKIIPKDEGEYVDFEEIK